MDRTEIIEQLAEWKSTILESMDHEELFGEDRLTDMREREIDQDLEHERQRLEEQDDFDLFGEERLKDWIDSEIESQLDSYADELETMDDEQLLAIWADNAADWLDRHDIDENLRDGMTEEEAASDIGRDR